MSNGILGTNRVIAVLADGTTHTMEVLHSEEDTAHRYLETEADFFADRVNNTHPRTVALMVVELASGRVRNLYLGLPNLRKYLDANRRIEASRR